MNSESGPEPRAPAPGSGILDLLQSAATTPTRAKRQGPGRDPKTAKSRRKEKHRRRANSHSLRRGG